MANQKKWLIPDMYYPSQSVPGPVFSHEAVCVLNTTDTDAEVDITLYFEDQEPMALSRTVCPARRTAHIRMDLIRTEAGGAVPQDVPYAAVVTSNVDLAVQYSRADARQEALAMMTAVICPVT